MNGNTGKPVPKKPPVSDRLSLTERYTASEHSTALDEVERGDCTLALILERQAVGNRFFSDVIPMNIFIPGDICAIETCNLATPERAWNEFERTLPGTKRPASEYGVLIFKTEAEHSHPATWLVGRRSPSLAQRFAAALKIHDIEDALDVIFEAVDLALLAGKFRECDRALASVNVDEWPTDLLGGLLSITLAASHELPARAAFFERTRRVLIERGDDTPGLLDGLE